MGNVPMSCCRSKSPRSNRDSLNRSNSLNHRGNCADGQYSSNHGGHHSKTVSHRDDYDGGPSHILQHISEREPDDLETDPSSNPSNRPIFATRKSNFKNNKFNNYSDSYSSNNSTSRRLNNTLMSSQDHGYNSTTSTNLTHFDGLQLNDSFGSSIQSQQAIKGYDSKLSSNENDNDNRLLLLNSPTSSNDIYQSSPNIDRVQNNNRYESNSRYFKNNMTKSSSCSTIFIDGSTISQPDLKQTIKCVSLAIYYHIKNRTSDSSVEIFDETLHPLKIPSTGESNTKLAKDELIILGNKDNNTISELHEPTQQTIYSFVKTLFNAAQLTSEYAITTLVYLERLMTYAEMDLTPKTWRRIFLGAILLSSKVWEDQAVWNVDYAQILEGISVEDINELERQFLELIQFNSNVPSSVYAKYYFHLRTLALKNGIDREQIILTVGKAKILEAMSRTETGVWEVSPIHKKSSPKLKRHTSLERSRFNGRTKAVLM